MRATSRPVLSLAETQKLLWRLLSARDGVAAGLAELGDAAPPGGLEAVVRGDDRLGPVARLDVYANMYFFRILECLKEDYPAVAAVLGDAGFHDLVTAYLVEHPSTHASLRWIGRHLPAFLERHEATRVRPDLAAVARLEWAILDAFDAPDAEPLAPDRLADLAAERWADAVFRLTPSLGLVVEQWDVEPVWTAATNGTAIPPPLPTPRVVRVWRKELRVFHRAVDPPEAAALEKARHGEPFAAVCEAVAAAAPADAAERAATVLAGWFADGLVVGVDSASA